MAAARESPEWSSRQLATWITDHLGLSVAESTVFLKKEGLIKTWQLLAGKEYQRKTWHVGHRRFVFQSIRLGLLLHGDRDGLLPVHLSPT